jgi:hypothetical protein
MEASDSFKAVGPIYNYMTSLFKKTVASQKVDSCICSPCCPDFLVIFVSENVPCLLQQKRKDFFSSYVTIPYPVCLSLSHNTDKECRQIIFVFRASLKI